MWKKLFRRPPRVPAASNTPTTIADLWLAAIEELAAEERKRRVERELLETGQALHFLVFGADCRRLMPEVAARVARVGKGLGADERAQLVVNELRRRLWGKA